MKLALVILTLLAPVFAQAASAPKVVCNVSSNGNGHDWESVFSFSKDIQASDREVSLPSTPVTAYGHTFSIDGGTSVTRIAQADFSMVSYGLVLHIQLDGGAIELSDLAIGTEGIVETTGNLADTHTTFSLKDAAGHMVSYTASCAIKPAQ